MKTLDILKNNYQNPSKDYKRVDTGFVVNREEIIKKKITKQLNNTIIMKTTDLEIVRSVNRHKEEEEYIEKEILEDVHPLKRRKR